MNTVVSVFGVEPRRIGGNENFARELSLQLGQHGWRSVLCFLTEPPADVREYLNLPNVTIEILENSWRPSLTATKKLIKILRKYRPKILHLHFVGFLNTFSWTGRLLSAERIFFTDQASRPENYVATRASFRKRILGRLLNWPLTKVICVSDYNRRCMTTLDVLPADRFECIYNSVDLSRVDRSAERAASFRQSHAIPGSRKLITQVSWLIPEKGVSDLLQATALLVAKDEDVQLVLVGDGAHRDEYQRLASQLGLNGRVTWAGLIQDPFAEGVYDAADVVCQVSRWQEAFGWVLAEAMASKKPVIGTTVGGIPEIIQDGKCGYLIDPGSPQRLAERLTQLLRDEGLRKQMGEAGCEIVKSKFELQKNVARLIKLYGISRSSSDLIDRG